MWIDDVDQPRTLDDLSWWRDNRAFRPPVEDLELQAPLAYGADDWIVPRIENAAEFAARCGDPERVDVRVFPHADHRPEVPARTDADGR